MDHAILLQLERYGIHITALQLIQSYLSQRKKVLKLTYACSEAKPFHSSVPQGSLLGPLLFIPYLNDIVIIRPRVTFIIYTDDSSVFFSGKNISEVISSCDDSNSGLGKWATSNSIRINQQKTKAVIFRPINNIIPPHRVIVLNSCNIDIVDSFKCPGVIL